MHINYTFWQIKESIIDATTAQIVSLDTSENVTLKITYEFNAFTTNKLLELINYEEKLTTIGSFSISSGPRLTVFEATSKYSINTMYCIRLYISLYYANQIIIICYRAVYNLNRHLIYYGEIFSFIKFCLLNTKL